MHTSKICKIICEAQCDILLRGNHGPRLLPESQYYVTHVVTKLQFVTYSVTLSRHLPLTGDAFVPPPSRDIPLAMFVSAWITITPVMIVPVCSVTNYPPPPPSQPS